MGGILGTEIVEPCCEFTMRAGLTVLSARSVGGGAVAVVILLPAPIRRRVVGGFFRRSGEFEDQDERADGRTLVFDDRTTFRSGHKLLVPNEVTIGSEGRL